MTNLNTKSNEIEKVKVQNVWMEGGPRFCSQPTWFMDGCEKKIRIGNTSFNYIDYLEAWHSFDCGTYRNRVNSLLKIRKDIENAFKEIETHK